MLEKLKTGARRPLARFLVSIGAVGLALLVREAMTSALGPDFPEYLLFYPTVMIVALLAGLWPAVTSIVVAAAMILVFWLIPGRAPLLQIGTSDFVGEPYYTYDDLPEGETDPDLAKFSIEKDRAYVLPAIKLALKKNPSLLLFGSPWSPPAWMKTNNDMLHGGKLKAEYAQTWAEYFVKYVGAYKAAGIPIWGLTVQNEAMATQVWESCIFTAAEERDFVRDHLGPVLHDSGLGDVKIMIWDHNRGIMYQRAQVAYEDPNASRYIWGTAFHWYIGNHYENVGQTGHWPGQTGVLPGVCQIPAQVRPGLRG